MTDTTPLPSPTRLTVDLTALVANRRRVAARVAPTVEVAAVVKADAYGVGAGAVVPALARDGARTFFVAHVSEGIAVRAALAAAGHDARTTRVFVLNGLMPDTAAAFAAHDLAPVLGSMAEIEDWAAFCAGHGTARAAAVHVDTGMNRHGLALDEARALAARPDLIAAAGLTLVMSHLACADEPGHPLNRLQLERFGAVRALMPQLAASLANSAGIFLDPAYHFDLVRPGVAVYGGAIVSGEASPMAPVVGLAAKIVQVRDVPAGESVGYGARQRTTRPSRIAIISVGYADGFHRAASSADGAPGARGWIGGVHVPFIGRISMDLAAIDVTEAEGVMRGDTIELIGPHVSLQEVAATMGTIDYETLTSLGRRYQRHYLGV